MFGCLQRIVKNFEFFLNEWSKVDRNPIFDEFSSDGFALVGTETEKKLSFYLLAKLRLLVKAR